MSVWNMALIFVTLESKSCVPESDFATKFVSREVLSTSAVVFRVAVIQLRIVFTTYVWCFTSSFGWGRLIFYRM